MELFIKRLGSFIFSLFLATMVWVAAINEQNPFRVDDYTHSVSIEITPPVAGLVTTDNLPETVRLRLRAPERSWQDLPPSKFKASIDLSQSPKGFNDVPVKVVVSDSEVEIIDIKPQKVGINIQVEQTISRAVKIEILDAPPLGYVNRIPAAEPATVTIIGPVSLINQVDKAISQISIRGSKETVERTINVSVRDKYDQIISGITVKPAKVKVTLPIDQRFGYRDVSVKANVKGQAAPGYRVNNISIDPPTLTIVGSPSVLRSVSGFIETTPINLSGATESISRTVPLALPDGVAVVLSEQGGEGPGGVQIAIGIAAIEDGVTLRRPVVQQGISPAYWWKASPKEAEVFLSGPVPRLKTLKVSEVQVIIDLFGLKPGVFQIQPTVFLPDGIRIDAILPDTIEITIGLNPTKTPTPTSTPLPTPTPTVTPVPPTHTPTATRSVRGSSSQSNK